MEGEEARIINLGRYRTAGVRVFSGRKRGEKVREALHLDQLDPSPNAVVVRIPDDALAVTSSFFLGMFGGSIKALGEERFRAKYRFEGPAAGTIDGAIRYAARSVNPLQK